MVANLILKFEINMISSITNSSPKKQKKTIHRIKKMLNLINP
jgi:hypothetical protein